MLFRSHMFYTGMTPGRCYMGLAISGNGVDWEKHGDNPLIKPGPAEWDSIYASCSSVVLTPDEKWRLYYAGRKDMLHKYYAIGMAELNGDI